VAIWSGPPKLLNPDSLAGPRVSQSSASEPELLARDVSGSSAPAGARALPLRLALAALSWISVPRRVRAAVSVIAGVALWQLFVTLAHPSNLIMVGPWTVFQDARLLASGGYLWTDLRVSMEEFGLGFVIALVAGILAGLRLGTGGKVSELVNPWVTILYTVPVIALAPLFIVALGIGMRTKVVVVAVSAFFPVAINTRTGVKGADPGLHEVCRAFRASRIETFRYMILPGAVPFILTGVRLALGRGLISLVFADLFGATAGLGYLILSSEQNIETGNVYVAIVLLALIGLFLSWIVGVLERHFSTYRSDTGGLRA
jgi:ABC-type nitrate/sulfonate/bicarbonate transport system permease component